MTATFHQLNPPMPVETPHGKALAHFLLDYGPEHHVLWGCFIDATRECWWVPNPDVRAQSNPSMGRPDTPKIGTKLRIGLPNDYDPFWMTALRILRNEPSADKGLVLSP